MDALRDEIISSQKSRFDLMKWKLVLVSTLSATGLGLKGSPTFPHVELILFCIPFVCVYIDLLCHHYALNTHVIGQFIRTSEGDEDKNMIEYEMFAKSVRKLGNKKISAYDFERWALNWSSLFISFLIIIFSIYNKKLTSIAIAASGIMGILMTIIFQESYNVRRKKILELNQRN
ncbi:hypothetical protein QUF80_16045 [Desulfococcaceae bacterium HSG8]|nr:hypothetical protein [Desulfococcaceae bacterium HSG8]